MAVSMSSGRPIIFIIDDDASVRRSLKRVMTSAGMDSQGFGSVDEFVASAPLGSNGCIIADMDMRGTSSFDLRSLLDAAHSPLPVIFLTAEDTDQARATAREAGAAGFFRKPVDTQALLDAVTWALNQPRSTHPA
jgi:FixJ family two-component response regulator